MVNTRETKDEIEASVSHAINKCLASETFIQTMVKNISQAIIKTVEEKVSKLEETVEDLHHKILNMQKEYDDKNSTLIARMIKMESDKASLENRFSGWNKLKGYLI
ncbi:hypothetical protein JTB14_029053 [Gonioctena quinquepunctata]|nr:hypothetical protein JTB14_029053 [Gonioctena quinquepunctata]